MKTAREILNHWDEEQYNDWYAIDELKADGTMLRLTVGTLEDIQQRAASAMFGAVDYSGTPCVGEMADEPFYRVRLLEPASACMFFAACADEIQGETVGKLMTVKEAAEATGRTRQAIHDLVKRGRLHGEYVFGELRIDGTELAAFKPYYK